MIKLRKAFYDRHTAQHKLQLSKKNLLKVALEIPNTLRSSLSRNGNAIRERISFIVESFRCSSLSPPFLVLLMLQLSEQYPLETLRNLEEHENLTVSVLYPFTLVSSSGFIWITHHYFCVFRPRLHFVCIGGSRYPERILPSLGIPAMLYVNPFMTCLVYQEWW